MDPTPKKKPKSVVHIIDDDDVDYGLMTSNRLVDCPACPARIPVDELNAHLDVCLQ